MLEGMGTRPAPPGSKPGQPGPDTKARKARAAGIAGQIKPIVITAAITLGLAGAYWGVRSAVKGREAAEVPAALQASLSVPSGWKPVQLKAGPAKARWAFPSSPGHGREGLFVSRYELAREPKSRADFEAVRAEAVAGLKATGAPRQLHRLKWGRQAAQGAWAYRYRAGRLRVRVWLIVSGRGFWQLSCQASRPAVLARCTRAAASFRPA